MADWLRPPRDPDSLPDSSELSGPCPRCGRVSYFSSVEITPLGFHEQRSGGDLYSPRHPVAKEQVSVLQCNGCQGHIVVVEQNPYTNVAIWRGVQWWPVPSVSEFDPSVPAPISAAYDEAQRCLNANAPNAAAAMLRNVIAQIVIDKGSESAKGKRNLSEKIVQMIKDGGPLGALGDWAVHVNLYGNVGAHPEVYGTVTSDEAKDVAALTRTMIELLYEAPAKFVRGRSGRGS